MIGTILKRTTRTGVATVVQVLGAATAVAGVLLLAGLAWALVAGGLAALAFGLHAEFGLLKEVR